MRLNETAAFAWPEVRSDSEHVVVGAGRMKLENMKVDAFPNHRHQHGLLPLQ
ncbi:hypothetical protein A2U01_0015757 [Trifolium medium]|uniref:Uncharacterized protein n=1 Tax=Trifolium medium TaxID=97028 RepID=A0A392N4P8_9FABA|nr:hypothetical protein [Trifolium medium]